MLEWIYFGIGVVNNLYLIVLFLIRDKIDLDLLGKIGRYYFLFALPTLYCVFLALKEKGSTRYLIFLGIFLAFLFLEWLFDYVLKVDFRSFNDWRTFVPYLALYYAMNYGFVVMTWKYLDVRLGVGMLVLWIVQTVLNVLSHP